MAPPFSSVNFVKKNLTNIFLIIYLIVISVLLYFLPGLITRCAGIYHIDQDISCADNHLYATNSADRNLIVSAETT